MGSKTIELNSRQMEITFFLHDSSLACVSLC